MEEWAGRRGGPLAPCSLSVPQGPLYPLKTWPPELQGGAPCFGASLPGSLRAGPPMNSRRSKSKGQGLGGDLHAPTGPGPRGQESERLHWLWVPAPTLQGGPGSWGNSQALG